MNTQNKQNKQSTQDKQDQSFFTVFVYGTLKQGHGNHRVISQFDTAELIEERATLQNYSMASLGTYPAIFPDKGGVVVGEVWSVPTEALGPLDRLEGYPNFYDRTEVEVGEYDPIVYFIDRSTLEGQWGGLKMVEGGEW